jgi:hypothetical protein
MIGLHLFLLLLQVAEVVLRLIEFLRIRANREVDHLPEVEAFIPNDFPVGTHLVEIFDHHTESGDDLFLPGEGLKSDFGGSFSTD